MCVFLCAGGKSPSSHGGEWRFSFPPLDGGFSSQMDGSQVWFEDIVTGLSLWGLYGNSQCVTCFLQVTKKRKRTWDKIFFLKGGV